MKKVKKEKKTAIAKDAKEIAKSAKSTTVKDTKTVTEEGSKKIAKDEKISEKPVKVAKEELGGAGKKKEEDIKEAPKSHKPQKPHIKKHGKKYKEVSKLINKSQFYLPEEAVVLMLKTRTTKFDSSVEAHIKLGIKPSLSDQNIRTVVDLPQGAGKKVKVAAIVSAGKEKEVKDAGADVSGGDDLISKIEKGFLDFDIVVATPDMMGKIGKLGKMLGTKGLMPNPKTETVTDKPERVIKLIKKGRVELKNDSFGIVHASFGKVSFGKEKLKENLKALIEALSKSKPQSVKGQFVKSISLSTTMGPSVKIDINKLNTLTKES